MTFDLSRVGAWHDLPFFTDTLPQIEAALFQETAPIYPPKCLTFASLERCQPDQTKVVILGQDPYHSAGKADGLAFSIMPNFQGNLASLGNIFKELESDLNVIRTKTTLDDWADQGVLLLNTSLTVRQGAAGAHSKIGWAVLIDQVLERLLVRPRAFMLWGKPAQSVARHIPNTPHLKIETAHPSPLSAHRGFFGARPFSTVNQWLMEQGHDPIHWGDPGV